MTSVPSQSSSGLPPLYAVVQDLHRRHETCLNVVEDIMYGNLTAETWFRSLPSRPNDETISTVEAYLAMVNVEVLFQEVLNSPHDPELQSELLGQVQHVGAMVAELAPGMADFLPSRLLMSLHTEMFLAHSPPTRPIDYSSVRRDDPRINSSSWVEIFPGVTQWYAGERASTPVPSILTVARPTVSANGTRSDTLAPPAASLPDPNPFELAARNTVTPPDLPSRTNELPVIVVTGKRPRSSHGRRNSRVVSKQYVEIDEDEEAVVKAEVVEPQLPNPPRRTPRAKTADSDRRARRYPHNIDRPPFPHNGTVPPPGSDLRDDMLTCDNCWKKRQTNPGLECILVNGRRACLRCNEGKVKCSRCPEGWAKNRTTMTEEEELEWMVSGLLPDMSSVPQGTGPAISRRSRGPSRKRSPGTARSRSKSRAEGKSKDKSRGKSKEKAKANTMEKEKGKSKAKEMERAGERVTTSRQVNVKAKKLRTFEGSEDEDLEDEVMEQADARPVKRPRTDAGPSRGPTIWITGGRKVHAGPSPPEPTIRQLQSNQAKMETRLDVIDSHFASSTAIQQQMLEALQRMSLSLQRLDARPSSTGPSPSNASPAVPLARRLQHLEASNNALFSAVDGLRRSSGSRSDSTPPNIRPPLPSTAGESLGPGRVSSPPPLRIRPRLTPDRRVVAEVQTSPLPADMPMIVDIPTSAIGVQTSPPLSPVRLAQGMQTDFANIFIPTTSVAVQMPSTPSPPHGIRLDVEIQTGISPPGSIDVTVNSPVVPPRPSTPDQATQVERDGSHSGGFGLSPLTSLSAFDLLPPSSSLLVSHSQESSASPSPAPSIPAQRALRRSTRVEGKKI